MICLPKQFCGHVSLTGRAIKDWLTSSNLYDHIQLCSCVGNHPNYSPRCRHRLPWFSSTACRQARVQQMSVTVRNPAQSCSMNELWCYIFLIDSTLLHTGHINLFHVVRTLVVRFVERLVSFCFQYVIWYYLTDLNIHDIQKHTVSVSWISSTLPAIREVQPPAQHPFTSWMVESTRPSNVV